MAADEAENDTDAPGSPKYDSTGVSAMLQKSKKEGQKRRMRITGTCLLLGTLGAIFGVTTSGRAFVLNRRTGERYIDFVFVGLTITFISVTIVLLGVLPTDSRAIKEMTEEIRRVKAAIVTFSHVLKGFKNGAIGDQREKVEGHPDHFTGHLDRYFADVHNSIQDKRNFDWSPVY